MIMSRERTNEEVKRLAPKQEVLRMTLKNRVVMMPMGSDFAGHDGELSDEHIKYYELRARGGTGLVLY